jgi:hypothetical protein
MLIGVTLYTGVLSSNDELRIAHIFPLSAGLFFAATNLMSGRISDELGDKTDVINFYTLLYSFCMLPVVVVVFWAAGLMYLPGTSVGVAQADAPGIFCGGSSTNLLLIFMIIAVAALFSLLANICIAHAFTVSKNDAAVASIDLTIIGFAVGVDLIRSLFCDDPKFWPDVFGIKGLGIVCIFGAAVVTTWLYEDEVKKMAKGKR